MDLNMPMTEIFKDVDEKIKEIVKSKDLILFTDI
jgi:hypothetical protein